MSADNFVKYLNYIKNKNTFDFLDSMHFNNTVNNYYYTLNKPQLNNFDYVRKYDNREAFKDSLNSYSLFNNQGWTIKESNVIPKVVEKVNKKHIDICVNSISDILKIIEENPYMEDTEYNIDLKSLHNIKNELTLLNNMIGMKSFKESLINQILYFIQN